MTTRTLLLESTITPQVRDYVKAVLADQSELHDREIISLLADHEARYKAIQHELTAIKSNLKTVNGIIDNDPAHRLTKAKLIRIATELGL